MSFDEQPDAPIHGECEAEINKLQEQLTIVTMRALCYQSALLAVSENADECKDSNEQAFADLTRPGGVEQIVTTPPVDPLLNKWRYAAANGETELGFDEWKAFNKEMS